MPTAPDCGLGGCPSPERGGSRVVVIEPRSVVRRGIMALLASDPALDVVGGAGSVADGLRLVAHALADVVLVSAQRITPAVLNVVVALRSHPLPPAVVVLAHQPTDNERVEAAAAGAAAVADACGGEADILALIERAGTPPGQHLLPRERRTRPPCLTKRQQQIVRLIADGRSNPEIADALGLRPSTVKNHVSAILRAFGVDDRTQAVIAAVRHGVLNVEPDAGAARHGAGEAHASGDGTVEP